MFFFFILSFFSLKGDGVIDCGEECDSGGSLDDACFNCISIVNCANGIACSKEGAIGNVVPEKIANPKEGTATVSTVPIVQPIDMVFSPDGSFALFLDYDSNNYNYRVMKVFVEKKLSEDNAFIIWNTTNPVVVYSSSNILTSVNIVNDGVHALWALVVDMEGCALLKINITDKSSSVFAGEMGNCGFSETEILFDTPIDVALFPAGDRGLLTDTGNNCVREINLITSHVIQFSGTCGRPESFESKVSVDPSAVVYLQPQKIVIHPSLNFAVVYSYTSFPSITQPQYSSMGLLDEVQVLNQLWLINGRVGDSLVVPGSSTVELWNGNSYSSTTRMFGSMDLAFDNPGVELFFFRSFIRKTPPNDGRKFDEAIDPSVRDNVLYKLKLAAGTVSVVDTLDTPTPTLGQQVKFVVLDTQLLLMDFVQSQVLSIALNRPSGRFGNTKKCYSSRTSHCVCVDSFKGETCRK